MTELQVCRVCIVEKLTTDFYVYSGTKRRKICKECYKISNKEHYKNNKKKRYEQSKEWKRNNVEKDKDYKRKYNYGMSYGLYEKIKSKQNGKCAICDKAPKDSLVVDHQHRKRNIRGLLCRKCNIALGLFNEDITIIKNAIKYLRRFI